MAIAPIYNGDMDETHDTQAEMVAGSDSPAVPDNQDIEKMRAGLNRANKQAAERRVALEAAQQELADLKAAQAQAAEKQAAEQGEYQKLWEAEKQRAEAAAQRAAELEAQIHAQNVAMLRQRIATEKGLPVALADRLQGETDEEISADADALLKALPTPAAASLNGGARGTGKGLTGDAAAEILNRYNIDPRYLK